MRNMMRISSIGRRWEINNIVVRRTKNDNEKRRTKDENEGRKTKDEGRKLWKVNRRQGILESTKCGKMLCLLPQEFTW